MTDLSQKMRRLAKLLDNAPESPQPNREILNREISESLERWERQLKALSSDPNEAGDPQTEIPLDQANLDGDSTPNSDDDTILIWSDGSCAPNPGPGGWGTLVQMQGQRQAFSGSSTDSTNNIMELTAAMEGLKRTPKKARVIVTTDSRYLVNGITKWIAGWKRKGWRKSDGDPVLNQDIWRELDTLTSERSVEWRWVRGHTGHPENELCDQLANQARCAQ